MLVKCSDIIEAMEKYAPARFAEDWDNVGLMCGESNKAVKKVMLALDVNDAVADEAVNKGVQLIVTHHPLIFKAVRNITDKTPLGRRLIKLIKNDIAVFSAHTNLDIADGGTNDTLAGMLGLCNTEGLEVMPDGSAMGRIGDLAEEMTFGELSERVKALLGADRLSVCGGLQRRVSRVGICTGKGAEFMSAAAAKGADVYITGDFGYHDGQTAEELGLCVIDGTHYLTEVIVLEPLYKYLKSSFDSLEVIISEVSGQTMHII